MVQSPCLWQELGCQTLQALLLAGPASWGTQPPGSSGRGRPWLLGGVTSLQHLPSQGRARDCVGSPCASPPTPTPPGVHLGATTGPVCIPTGENHGVGTCPPSRWAVRIFWKLSNVSHGGHTSRSPPPEFLSLWVISVRGGNGRREGVKPEAPPS